MNYVLLSIVISVQRMGTLQRAKAPFTFAVNSFFRSSDQINLIEAGLYQREEEREDGGNVLNRLCSLHFIRHSC